MDQDLRQNLIESLKEGIRFDGRKSDQYREITVETNVVNSAEGSARVKIGETEVLAGVKMEVGTPFPDKQDEGTIMVGTELLPLSNPKFESGPPGIQSIELARVVDRGIRESGAMDFKKLCIEEGEHVWLVVIDIITINDAGNLFDASALAAVAALKTTVFPHFDGKKIDYKKKTTKKLELKNTPLSVTVLKVGDHFIVDPTSEEENAYDIRLTVATIDDDTLCAMQKGGDSPMSEKDIEEMITIGINKCKELRKHIK